MRTFEASSSLPFSLSLHREFFEDERGGGGILPLGNRGNLISGVRSCRHTFSNVWSFVCPPHFCKRVEFYIFVTLYLGKDAVRLPITDPST